MENEAPIRRGRFIETAKLVLDLIKILIWPIIVSFFIIFFRHDITALLQRTESLDAGLIKLKAGSGQSAGDATKQAKKAPDIYFDTVKTDDSQLDCSVRARLALKNDGFLADGGEVGQNGSLFYGYNQDYVGVVACDFFPRLALIAVSGASVQEAADRRSKLSVSFQSTRR
jgi:hypothetical protein